VPRPRDAAAARSIRAAAVAILREAGYPGVTIEGVAARAGVAKTTVYRRWRSKAELLFDSTIHPAELGPPPDTGDLHGDLAAVAAMIVADLTRSEARLALPGLLADVAMDPDLHAALRERFIGAERAQLATIVARAAGRGEVPADTDPDLALDLLLGPLLTRALFTGGPETPLTPELGARVAAGAARALAVQSN
jgi:AcrR family transcriptional regulator